MKKSTRIYLLSAFILSMFLCAVVCYLSGDAFIEGGAPGLDMPPAVLQSEQLVPSGIDPVLQAELDELRATLVAEREQYSKAVRELKQQLDLDAAHHLETRKGLEKLLASAEDVARAKTASIDELTSALSAKEAEKDALEYKFTAYRDQIEGERQVLMVAEQTMREQIAKLTDACNAAKQESLRKDQQIAALTVEKSALAVMIKQLQAETTSLSERLVVVSRAKGEGDGQESPHLVPISRPIKALAIPGL